MTWQIFVFEEFQIQKMLSKESEIPLTAENDDKLCS